MTDNNVKLLRETLCCAESEARHALYVTRGDANAAAHYLMQNPTARSITQYQGPPLLLDGEQQHRRKEENLVVAERSEDRKSSDAAHASNVKDRPEDLSSSRQLSLPFANPLSCVSDWSHDTGTQNGNARSHSKLLPAGGKAGREMDRRGAASNDLEERNRGLNYRETRTAGADGGSKPEASQNENGGWLGAVVKRVVNTVLPMNLADSGEERCLQEDEEPVAPLPTIPETVIIVEASDKISQYTVENGRSACTCMAVVGAAAFLDMQYHDGSRFCAEDVVDGDMLRLMVDEGARDYQSIQQKLLSGTDHLSVEQVLLSELYSDLVELSGDIQQGTLEKLRQPVVDDQGSEQEYAKNGFRALLSAYRQNGDDSSDDIYRCLVITKTPETVLVCVPPTKAAANPYVLVDTHPRPEQVGTNGAYALLCNTIEELVTCLQVVFPYLDLGYAVDEYSSQAYNSFNLYHLTRPRSPTATSEIKQESSSDRSYKTRNSDAAKREEQKLRNASTCIALAIAAGIVQHLQEQDDATPADIASDKIFHKMKDSGLELYDRLQREKRTSVAAMSAHMILRHGVCEPWLKRNGFRTEEAVLSLDQRSPLSLLSVLRRCQPVEAGYFACVILTRNLPESVCVYLPAAAAPRGDRIYVLVRPHRWRRSAQRAELRYICLESLEQLVTRLLTVFPVRELGVDVPLDTHLITNGISICTYEQKAKPRIDERMERDSYGQTRPCGLDTSPVDLAPAAGRRQQPEAEKNVSDPESLDHGATRLSESVSTDRGKQARATDNDHLNAPPSSALSRSKRPSVAGTGYRKGYKAEEYAGIVLAARKGTSLRVWARACFVLRLASNLQKSLQGPSNLGKRPRRYDALESSFRELITPNFLQDMAAAAFQTDHETRHKMYGSSCLSAPALNYFGLQTVGDVAKGNLARQITDHDSLSSLLPQFAPSTDSHCVSCVVFECRSEKLLICIPPLFRETPFILLDPGARHSLGIDRVHATYHPTEHSLISFLKKAVPVRLSRPEEANDFTLGKVDVKSLL